MAIQWTTDLATGLNDIDREHQLIYEQIDGLVERVDNDRDAVGAARSVVDVLKRHVVQHFADERKHMAAFGYPALDEHEREHEEILAYVTSFEEELLAELTEPALLVAATRVLSNWILTHTNTFDRDFARYVRTQS